MIALTDGGILSFPGVYIILTARSPPKQEMVLNKVRQEHQQGKTVTELYKFTHYTFLHTHNKQHGMLYRMKSLRESRYFLRATSCRRGPKSVCCDPMKQDGNGVQENKMCLLRVILKIARSNALWRRVSPIQE